MLNNLTIEHEERSQRSATFLFDFENGSSQLIIILIGGILALVIAVDCCMLLCRYGLLFRLFADKHTKDRDHGYQCDWGYGCDLWNYKSGEDTD